MSWLARSLANSLGIDDDEEHNPQRNHDVSPREIGSSRDFYHKSSLSDRQIREYRPEEEDEDQSRGVKEDLSEFRDSLTRQFLGVANFLAPPPPPPPPPRLAAPEKFHDQITVSELDPSELSDPSVSGDDGFSAQEQIDKENGDRSEVGGLDVRGVSRFSGTDRFHAVPEDFQLDMRYDRLGTKVEEPGCTHKVVGVTDEVLAFAGNIAHHPETWLDFPIEEEDDLDGCGSQSKVDARTAKAHQGRIGATAVL